MIDEMFLYKSFQQLFFPLNTALFLFFISLFLMRREKHRKAGYRTATFALFFLTLIAFPPFSNTLLGWLEHRSEQQTLSSYPQASTIVVLGGTVSRKSGPFSEIEEVEGSRLVPAYRLFQLHKAPRIIVSGGNPYTAFNGEIRTEATDMRDYLVGLGVPRESIILEAKSRTTLENAEEVSKILASLPKGNTLLVTSAFHMPRAQLAFHKYGVDTVAVPTSRFVSPDGGQAWQNMPNAQSIMRTTIAVKEILGLFWYHLH